MRSAPRQRFEGADPTTHMLLEIRKQIVEETVSMNPAFDYEGVDEEVAQALLDLAYYGERHRDHLTTLGQRLIGSCSSERRVGI